MAKAKSCIPPLHPDLLLQGRCSET